MKRMFLCGLIAALTEISNRAAAPAIQFSTYLGGSSDDIATAIATGADGSIYVTGIGSTDFPQAQTLVTGGTGAWVAKLSADGSKLIYATLLGGFFPQAIAVDGAGQVYLAGHNYYNGFPLTNAIQASVAGGFDAAVMKLNAQGNQALFATYLGGTADDAALGIALDSAGAIWVCGVTTSPDFPTANQPFKANLAGPADGFLARLSNDGSVLQYGTYVGGANGNTLIADVAIDSADRPVMVGRTSAESFPVKNAFQAAPGGVADAFVTKFDSAGQALVFSTHLGGSGADSASKVGLDADGNIYVSGLTRSPDFPTRAAAQSSLAGNDDIFVTKLKGDGSDIVYSTYLGGGLGDGYRGDPFYVGDILFDSGAMAVTPAGRVLVFGSTYSGNFPLSNALKSRSEDYSLTAVAAMFEADGTLGFSTFLGGNGANTGFAAAPSADGSFVVAGGTSLGILQPDFPATPGAVQLREASSNSDAFVMKINTTAPPLPNDNFANAVVIDAATVTLLAQTGAATKEAGEPTHNGNTGGKSVWYRWNVPSSGRAIVSTDGSNFPTLLAIYHGTTLANLTPVQISGTVDQANFSEAKFAVTAGEMLWIAVDGRDGASGYLTLSATVSLPANDDFADRATITGATATLNGSNVGATGERGGDIARNSVWWKWTAPASGYYTFTTVGSDFDTGLGVFTGSALSNFQRISFSNGYTNQFGRVTFLAQAGTEYQVGVMGDYGAVGNIQLNLAPAARPTNDDFANRTRLTGRNESVTGTDFDSAYDQAESDFEVLAQSQIVTGHVVWWEWTPPIDGAAQITTINSTRIDGGDLAGTSLLLFTGDSIPTDKSAITVIGDTLTQAAFFLTDVHAGTHYQIGLDAVDWQQPVNFQLKITAIAPPKIIPGSVLIDAGGILRARVEGIEGHNYRVTSSADFKQWTPVSEFPAISGEFAFESAVGTGYRFFRVEEF